jgi:arylformamidase
MRVIDLSVSLRSFMPVWHSSPLPEIKPVSVLCRDGDNHETYFSTTHTGTHVDAPYHFVEKGDTVDRIPLESLTGDGYCLEFSSRKIGREELKSKWREEYDGNILLIRTGWASKRSFSSEFLYDFPGLNEDGASFLISRHIKAVGIDTLGIEPYDSSSFAVHRLLLGHNIPVIEDMVLGELIEGKRYFIIALPLKIEGASGAMARVIALES